MNDYWNDPPDHPEPPECCDEIMDVMSDGVCVCGKCGKRIEPLPDIEPTGLEEMTAFDEAVMQSISTCIHGNQAGNCDACDHASDIAFDAARERRMQ